jgi:uncharacterized protein YjbI with pentapeptide repeats
MNDENPAKQKDSSKISTEKKEQANNKASVPEPDEVKKLKESFDRVHDSPNKLRREYKLTFEAKQLGITVEEYRHLYELHWRDWTGFGGKKLWDVLQLIIVPLVLAGVAFYLSYTAKQSEQAQTEDRNRQESLNKYFDTMTNLLLENKLKTSKKDAEIRTIVRAKTLTTLDGLDGYRKWQLLRFLKEAQLIRNGGVIVSLSRANLIGAENIKADLSRTDLSKAILSDANLRNADFSDANLTKTFLTKANLEGANFENTNLKNALLNQANLKKADFRGANLDGANFKDADLSGAEPFSEKQKEQAKFCNTTMPNNKHEDRDCAKLKKVDPYDLYLDAG